MTDLTLRDLQNAVEEYRFQLRLKIFTELNCPDEFWKLKLDKVVTYKTVIKYTIKDYLVKHGFDWDDPFSWLYAVYIARMVMFDLNSDLVLFEIACKFKLSKVDVTDIFTYASRRSGMDWKNLAIDCKLACKIAVNNWCEQ